MNQPIPLHLLKNRATTGIEIAFFDSKDQPEKAEEMGAHRDDHYLFFLLDEGEGSIMIDFQEVRFHGRMLCYIAPGQVHHYINNGMIRGWYLAVDISLVPAASRDIFEGSLLAQQPVTLSGQQYTEAHNLLQLVMSHFAGNDTDTLNLSITNSLIQAFVGVAANYYRNYNGPGTKVPRAVDLARQFKALLTANITTHKSPSAYAAKLNVTEGYLNEVVKKITGFSVSYLIAQEVMLEAKRLLYYTQLNVKEIAHQLGYQDHTYFSRLYKKTEGITPLEFRARYHK